MKYSLRVDAVRNTKNKIISLSMATIVAIASLGGALPFILDRQTLAVSTPTEKIRGNTSSGENQPGWAFNRDQATSTPYKFTDAVRSIGDGSLYIMPIGSTPSDKFIAENFIAGTALADVESISFDYMLGNGVADTNAKHFYLNVYANFAESSFTNFYDCRYNIVAQTGSSSEFTSLTFNTTSPVDGQSFVTKSSNSPRSACPITPADMGEGATIRAYAINVGDTAAHDIGVHGYIDNVRLVKSGSETIYDFEPTPVAKTDSVNYYNLSDALTAANPGSVIELLEDIDLGEEYINIAVNGITVNGNGHTITTNNSWVQGSTGNGTTDYAIQLNADNVTINNLTISGTASPSPAGGINVFNRTGIVLKNINSQNNATAVAVVGSDVTIDGITSSDSTWDYAVNVDKGSAPHNGRLTIMGANTWNETHFIYVDDITKASVVDSNDQYKKVTLPHPETPNTTSAVYTLPSAPVNITLPISATLPGPIAIESPAGSISIAANTVISGLNWDGVLSAPDFVTPPVFSVPGHTLNSIVAVSVGSSTTRLNFSSPVKVTLPGQAAKQAGFVDHTSNFNPIDIQCGTNIEATLTDGVEECWTTEASNLIIWTMHFTTFVTYNAVASIPISQPGANNSTTTTVTSGTQTAGQASGSANTATSEPNVDETVAQVLGTESGIAANNTNETPVENNSNQNQNNDQNSSRFLGLGWWWILVLSGVGLLAYYWFVVRKADQA